MLQESLTEAEVIINTLNPKRRSHLMSLSHALKPILHIGKEGVSAAAVKAIQDAFNTRELLKVKVLEMAPQSARETGEILARRLKGTRLVQVIGRVVVLYRPDPDQPKIQLP